MQHQRMIHNEVEFFQFVEMHFVLIGLLMTIDAYPNTLIQQIEYL